MEALDEVLALEGAIVAFDFAPDGQVLASRAKAELAPETVKRLAQIGATVTQLFNSLAPALPALAGAGWAPQNGWLYCGGSLTLVVDNGRRAVVVDAAKVDLNRTVDTLFRSR
jgi:roadblock/LC7 domain-containing protein